MTNEVHATVITVSDRSYRGERDDLSGPTMVHELSAADIDVASTIVVPDEIDEIRAAVITAVEAGSRLVLLTGGTGISPRDVTGIALQGLLDERIPGIEQAIRDRGIATGAPGALLSRPVAGIIRSARALCIAGPGSRGGARDTAQIAVQVAAHALAQLDGDSAHGHKPTNGADAQAPASADTAPTSSTGMTA